MKVKKQHTILKSLLVGTVVIGLLAGCGSKSSTDSTNPEATKAAEGKKSNVTLTIAASQNWIRQADKDIAADFTQETGIKVDFQVNPDDQYKDVIKSKLATKEATDIIYFQGGVSAYELLPADNLLDLTNEAWVARETEWAKGGTTLDGKVIGLNRWGTDGWGIMYNPELFTKLNLKVPTTYEEFLAVCEAIKAAGIIPIFENAKDTWHLPLWLNNIAYQVSAKDSSLYGKLADGTTKFADIPQAEMAVAQLKELADKGYLGKDFMSNDWNGAIPALGEGKYAMILTYTSWSSEVKAKYPDSNADKWEMFPAPLAGVKSWATSAGGVIQVINKNSKNVEEAKQYFNYIAKADVLLKFYGAHEMLKTNEIPFKDAKNPVKNLVFDTVVANSPDGYGLDFEGGVKFFIKENYGQSFQDLLLNGKSPKQVIDFIDNDRAKLIKAATGK
ncbi:ABC transporter substrate-binding protein [Paenibacillus psychroresistens]|nr:ABC transporter substrate-binding protein [Paenibacillus psychroresistens]